MNAKLIGTLMVLIAGALPGVAAPCHQPQVIVQKQAHAEIVYPAVNQITVVLPTYGIIPYPAAYYSPAPALVAPDSQEDRFERLMQLLEQRLTATPANVQPVRQAAAASCAKCHDGSKADVPKLDFANLTADQKALASERVLDGSMPPKNQLTKAQRRVVLAEILK